MVTRQPRLLQAAYFSLAIAAVGSFCFFLIAGNNYSEVLYIQRRDIHERVFANTCTTQAEWIWLLVSAAVVLLPSLSLALISSPNRAAGTDGLFRQTICRRFFEKRHSNFRISWRTLLCAMNVIWFFLPLGISLVASSSSALHDYIFILNLIGAKAAWPALWNIAIVIFPVQRSGALIRLFGISHRDAFPIHFWAGHATGFWLILHAVLLSVASAMQSQSLQDWMETMLIPYKHYYTAGVVNFVGWVSLAMFFGLWISSRPEIRHASFEWFLGLHLVFSALFILFANLHDYNTLFFVMPGISAWMADRFFRSQSRITTDVLISEDVCSLQQQSQTNATTEADEILNQSNGENIPPNSNGHVRILTLPRCPIVSLTFGLSSDDPLPLPGSFVYLKVPSISRWQQHPFSVASVNSSDRTYTIYIKTLGDWTSKMVYMLKEKAWRNGDIIDEGHRFLDTFYNPTPIIPQHFGSSIGGRDFPMKLSVEGPYSSERLSCDSLSLVHMSTGYIRVPRRSIFVAGGVGLTGVSHLVTSQHELGVPVRLIWIVRNQTEMDCMIHVLRTMISTRRNTEIISHFDSPSDLPASSNFASTDISNIKIYLSDPHCQRAHVDNSPFISLAENKPRDIAASFHALYRKRENKRSASSSCDSAQDTQSTRCRYSTDIMFSVLAVVCTSLALLIARLSSCNRPLDPTHQHNDLSSFSNGTLLHECTMRVGLHLSSKQVCQMCSWGGENVSQSNIPCCSVEFCLLTFRGLPVLTSFFVAPFVMTGLLLLIRKGKPPIHHLLKCDEFIAYLQLDEADNDETTNSVGAEDMLSRTHQTADALLPATNINLFYQRPNIAQILTDELAVSTMDGNTDAATVVTACGPDRLINDIKAYCETSNSSIKIVSVTNY